MNDELKLFIDNFTPKEKEALKFASRIHDGTYRKGPKKEEYIWHPIRVAYLVDKYKDSKAKEDLICASLLHDTIEDTIGIKLDVHNDIIEQFGIQVGSLVKELTTEEGIKKLLGKTTYLSLKLITMTNYALVIKLCDRLDNISDLDNVDEAFKKRYIDETKKILYSLLTTRNENFVTDTHLTIINDIYNRIYQYEGKNFFIDNGKVDINHPLVKKLLKQKTIN